MAPTFTAVRQSASMIYVDVDPLVSPEKAQGKILSYHVFWKEKLGSPCTDFENYNHYNVSSPRSSFSVDPRLEYCVTVSAKTAAGTGAYGIITAVECKHLLITLNFE